MKRFFAVLVALAAASGIALANPTNTAPLAGEKLVQAAPAKAPAKSEPMDINSASAKDLATLPGIGEARAKDIIKGRPYKGKDDLVNRKVLTDKVYDGIKDQIIAKQMPR